MRRIAGVAVLVVCLACAAVALAAVPKKGTFEGQTQQKRPVTLEVDSNRDIAKITIWWKAHNCGSGDPQAHWGPDVTRYKSTIPVATDGSFTKAKKYQRTDEHGFTGHFRATIGGAFTKAKAANGTFSIKVRVTKAGKFVDTCHQTVTWSATHSG